VSARFSAKTDRGVATRRRILDAAVELAAAEGLSGLTIGRLAEELKMSKAGLFGYFGSKEELQIATIAAAEESFIERVITPAMAAPEGLPRLLALCSYWLDYAACTLKGGCFFLSAAADVDGRPGPVRDRVADTMRAWLAALVGAIKAAQDACHLDANADAAQIAFELNGLELAAAWARQLLDDRSAGDRARRGIFTRIAALATPPGRRVLVEITRDDAAPSA
jgi:AcrR family transcriptional regulator